MTSYRVELRIGGWFWNITKGDAANWTLAGGVPLAPLNVGWQYPNGPLWPAQPDPTNMRLSIAYPSAQAAADLVIGATVHLKVYAGVQVGDTELESVRFAGRIADVTGRPKSFGTPSGGKIEGWVVDLVCVDYTADLAETEVAGEDPFQGLGVRGHIARLFNLAGFNAPGWADGGSGAPQLVPGELGQLQAEPLSTAVDRYLRTYADGGEIVGAESSRFNHTLYRSQGWRRGVVRANLTGSGEPNSIVPWRIDWISRRAVQGPDRTITIYPLAFVFSDDLSKWTLEPTDPPEDVTDLTCRISADYVDHNAVWTRSKNTAPYRVIVSNNIEAGNITNWRQRAATLRNPGPDQSIARITDCNAINDYNAEYVAAMYLTDQYVPTDSVERFTWRASQDPSWPMLPSWFPDSGHVVGASQPILVYGLPESQTPIPTRGWYAGVLDSVLFTLSKGEFQYAFSLRAGAPRPGGDGEATASWGTVPTTIDPGELPRTWTNVDSQLHWNDLRLARPFDLV